MKLAGFSEMLITIDQTIWHQHSADHN